VRAAARTGLADFAALIGRLRDRAREAAVDELLRELIDAIRYGDHLKAEGPEGLERMENVRELLTGAAETVSDEGGEVGLTPLDHFLQRATLVAGVDHLDPSADAVTMMTLHNAKGLEFPVVFLTGLEDGLFPLAKAFDDPPLLEEERRLFYVGITRAERKLFISYAEQRRRNGEFLPSRPSSFLEDLPKETLDQQSTMKSRSSGRAFMAGYSGGGSGYGRWRGGDRDVSPTSSPAARRPGVPVARNERISAGAARFADDAESSQDAPTFIVGARVRHRKFGTGTIAELAGIGRDAKAKIDFDDASVGRKTLVIAQANLERGWE
jgi:DNA helicase II / ATP-dependent DNA helicase PcrA